MVYKAHEAIAATYAKRIRQAVEGELKNPGYLEKIKTLPHSREATNVTALLLTKVLLMGMNHALGKKKKGHKFADGVDERAQAAQDVEVLPFQEAVEYMQGRLPLDAKEYYKLADKARFRAFTVSLLADGDLLAKTKNMLAKNLEEGGGLKDFLVKTDTDLLKGVGMAGAGGGWYWETVYRTGVQTAYNVGRAIGFETVPPVALELVGIGDARQTELCKSLTQPPVRRLYGDEFWKRFWPPLHFNCRTTVRAIYDPQELEEQPITGIPADAESHKSLGWGSYPLDSDKWWEELPSMKKRAQAYGVQGMIERARERLVTGGSSGGILDKSYEEQEEYAKRAYETIRKKNARSDIARVAKSSGLSEKDVEKIRNHVFIDKHNLKKGYVRFDPDPEIAHAWEALEQGRPTELDILLLNHELEELTLMEKYGYSYEVAHLYANKKYPWEYKKRGGMTDDQIQALVKKLIENYI